MKSFIAFLIMIVWSAVIYIIMNFIGFEFSAFGNSLAYWGNSLGAAVMLLIGLIGNVWIYFLVVGEQPWLWTSEKK